MASKGPKPAWRRWLLREPSPYAASLLFCLPYIGTGASMYHRWPRYVGTTEVCPVQFAGREDRFSEPPHETYEALAEDMVGSLRPILDRPFAFFGHCCSVYIGFESGIELMSGGGPLPVRLFVSSMMPPHQSQLATWLQLSEPELRAAVEDMMRARGAEPLPELVDMALEMMRDELRAYRRYRREPGQTLACPITVIGWSADAFVPAERTHGWSDYGGVDHELLEGNHWSFLEAPPDLLATIERGMGR